MAAGPSQRILPRGLCRDSTPPSSREAKVHRKVLALASQKEERAQSGRGQAGGGL